MTVAADYREIAKRYQRLPERMVRAGAAEMRDHIQAELKTATGGDFMLSGTIRRKGAKRVKLGTTVKVSPGLGFSTATVQAGPKRMLGIWSWLENGTAPHLVGKPRGGMTRGLHMKIGGDWRTGPTDRPTSMSAKRTFTQGVLEGTGPAERAMEDVWAREDG